MFMDILSMFWIRQLFKSIVHIYFECTKCHTAGLDCHSTDSNDIFHSSRYQTQLHEVCIYKALQTKPME